MVDYTLGTFKFNPNPKAIRPQKMAILIIDALPTADSDETLGFNLGMCVKRFLVMGLLKARSGYSSAQGGDTIASQKTALEGMVYPETGGNFDPDKSFQFITGYENCYVMVEKAEIPELGSTGGNFAPFTLNLVQVVAPP